MWKTILKFLHLPLTHIYFYVFHPKKEGTQLVFPFFGKKISILEME